MNNIEVKPADASHSNNCVACGSNLRAGATDSQQSNKPASIEVKNLSSICIVWDQTGKFFF